MAHYFFDLRDGVELVPDEEGMELRDIEAVQGEAARALAGLAWDAMRSFAGTEAQKMSIEVRDGVGPVMEANFSFRIIRKH